MSYLLKFASRRHTLLMPTPLMFQSRTIFGGMLTLLSKPPV